MMFHQLEVPCSFFSIHRLTIVLKEKEESVRKLKETLRKSQQQGDESCKNMEIRTQSAPSPVFYRLIFSLHVIRLVGSSLLGDP